MKKTVRWGLLSTARINRRLIPVIRASKRGELAAVASRDQAKSEAYAAQWEIPRALGSYEALLADENIDAVYISLPNSLHAEWTIKALEAGKNVLVEKPFATTVEDADRMIAASRSTGRVLAEGFMYRHHPQTKLVGEWVREGRLGDIRLVRGIFSFFMQDREGNVRLDPTLDGGALWDVGIYPLSFARFVFDHAPERAAGQQWTGPTGVDESFAGLLSYPDGSAAQISCGFCIPFDTMVDIHGNQGRIRLNRPFLNMNERDREILFSSTDGKTEKLRVKSIDPYQGEVEDMNSAILDGTPTLVTLEQSRDHVRIARALHESARTGQEVPLD